MPRKSRLEADLHWVSLTDKRVQVPPHLDCDLANSHWRNSSQGKKGRGPQSNSEDSLDCVRYLLGRSALSSEIQMGLNPSAVRLERGDKRSLIARILFGLIFIAFVGESTIDTVMYAGRWKSPFVVFSPLLTPIPGISLWPWQILLIGLFPFCLRASLKQLHAREMDRAILVSVVSIAVTLIWGMLNGGSGYFAYYQLWHFTSALLIAYMLMSFLRTERDLVSLGKLFLVAATIRAVICAYYYWAYLHNKPLPEYVTNHEDTMLWVSAIQITLIWAILNGGKTAWRVTIFVSACALYAIVLNHRRIAWVELMLSFPFLYFLIGPGPLRKRIKRWIMIAAPLLLIYFVAGTMSDSSLFAPVHALATTGSSKDASSLTREEEIRNLLRTLVDTGNPFFGTGWGRPYEKLESFYSNYHADWILVLYTPHNSIVGLAAYSGLVGVLGIWGVIPVSAYLAVRGYSNASGAVVRTAAMASIGALCIYSVQCYGDIALQSFSGTVLLGVAMAVAARVSVWGGAATSHSTAVQNESYREMAPKVRPGKTPPPVRRLPR
jgi:hypothetical protein